MPIRCSSYQHSLREPRPEFWAGIFENRPSPPSLLIPDNSPTPAVVSNYIKDFLKHADTGERFGVSRAAGRITGPAGPAIHGPGTLVVSRAQFVHRSRTNDNDAHTVLAVLALQLPNRGLRCREAPHDLFTER